MSIWLVSRSTRCGLMCAGAVILFATYRLLAAPPVPGERQRRFLVLPRTTPLAAKLDPISQEAKA